MEVTRGVTALSERAGDALFRPVRANVFEETIERLLQAIKLGLIAPGERLPPERELAARLDVSRVTLREAIRSLQQAGYVQSRRGRYGGSFVTHPHPGADHRDVRSLARTLGAELEDRLTLRHVLECGAAETAARRLSSAEERAHLQQRLAETTAASLPDYRRLDSRLHLAIAEVAGVASLTSMVADIRMQMNELLDGIPLLEQNIKHSDEQHAHIVAAILAGDATAAHRLMAEHLAGTAALLRGFLS
ncbi:FadR/GntR family transcriptional regulator [Pseudonocardia spinosispora]|uniref:FadR/GntR family transcriptional regulator n=1 Tax=Pseudonocardia spinosispora TaxID=103441 RepID=UPI0004067106|nr:GntR family transcriptional regulator [Pseudonocardia spinosispora]